MRISDWSSDVCSSDLGSAAIRIARRSMAGPSRAAPPMPDPFDPAEFDAPPPADPGADYRVLLDAMRQAGADGIAQQSAALVQRIEQDARQRLEWGQRMGTAVDDLQRVAGQRSEEHTPELKSLMRISYAVFCLKKKTQKTTETN